MILINLMPHREAARKRRRENFYTALGAAAMAGGIVAGAIYLWYQTQLSSQHGKNSFLQAENKRLDNQIKDIATLQAEIASLRARQEAVEDLQSDRNLPVHLLNELVKQVPEGIYITSMQQDNRNVTLKGVAQSNERVSELLRNFGNNSPWLTKPDLIEIVASNVTLSQRDQRRVASFTMRVALIRPTDAASAAADGSPVASASAKQ